jgi:hypothetical protein
VAYKASRNLNTFPIGESCFADSRRIKDAYLWAKKEAGWGIEVDENAAAKAPLTNSAKGLHGGGARSGKSAEL